MELKHCTSAEIFANMNETCDTGIFTKCDNETRHNFEETSVQATYRK